MIRGKVYFIGAGPGDIGLLSEKAKKLIESADVIVYDRLVNSNIINYADSNAKLIYVGKENTEGGSIQEKINSILLEETKNYSKVVRLKGGDSFVFGRGGEEILALLEENVPFELIPGISSSIAVPEYAGIPVTHRGIARSFHVFTGHTMENGEWPNFEVIAKLEGTLVFLMGIKNLPIIVKDLIENQKDKNTPVAIIENGASTKQRVVKGTLENIVEIAKKEKIVPPSIIVIGEVVNFRDQMKWFEDLPLFGKKVMITRDKKDSIETSEKIALLGGDSVIMPFIQKQFLKISDKDRFDAKFFKRFSAVLFLSSTGIESFFEYIPDVRVLGDKLIGVNGKKSTKTLRKYRLIPDVISSKGNAECLIEEMIKKLESDNRDILVITSDISPLNTEELKEKYKRNFEKIVSYETLTIDYDKKEIEAQIKECDAITFFSPSAVHSFVKGLDSDIEFLNSLNIKIISLGATTTKTLDEYGIKNVLTAKHPANDEIYKLI